MLSSAHAGASESSDSEIAFFASFGVATLVPVTIDSIWLSSCRNALSDAGAQQWNNFFHDHATNSEGGFELDAIRVGVRLGWQHYYFDNHYRVLHSNGTVSSLVTASDRSKVLDLVKNTVRKSVCKRNVEYPESRLEE